MERAEALPLQALTRLLLLAKELTDRRLGVFVFVFAPSDTLSQVQHRGALTRASVIDVGDLPRDAALAYLQARGCTRERAEHVYGLAGGHLPVLAQPEPVRSFCDGAIGLESLADTLLQPVRERVRAVDQALGCEPLECSCPALCRVAAGEHCLTVRRAALVGHGLARFSLLAKGEVVDSPLARLHCNCSESRTG